MGLAPPASPVPTARARTTANERSECYAFWILLRAFFFCVENANTGADPQLHAGQRNLFQFNSGSRFATDKLKRSRRTCKGRDDRGLRCMVVIPYRLVASSHQLVARRLFAAISSSARSQSPSADSVGQPRCSQRRRARKAISSRRKLSLGCVARSSFMIVASLKRFTGCSLGRLLVDCHWRPVLHPCSSAWPIIQPGPLAKLWLSGTSRYPYTPAADPVAAQYCSPVWSKVLIQFVSGNVDPEKPPRRLLRATGQQQGGLAGS